MSAPQENTKLTTAEAARHLRVSGRWLQKRRESDLPPAFERYAGRIFYRLTDIQSFEAASRIEPRAASLSTVAA